MTPKEKAKDLINKMNVIHYLKLRGKNKDSKGLPISMYDDQIKQCALIAVDEVINNIPKNIKSEFEISSNPMIEFWQEVKQEIEDL